MSVRRSLALSFLQRNITTVVYFATTIVIARLLTPEQIGIFSLCAAVVTISATFREFGISEYIIQERKLNADRLRHAFGVALVVGWATGLCVWLLRSPLAAYYREPGVAEVLGVLSLNFLLLPLASPAFALLSRSMDFRSLFVIQTTSGVAGSLCSVALAWSGFGTVSLAWGSVATTVVQLLGVTWFRPRDSWLLPQLRGAAPVWRYCMSYVSATILEILARHSRDFIVARHFGFAAVGLYSRAQGLIDQFHSTVTVSASSVVTPLLARENRQNLPLRERYASAMALFTALAWPFAGFVAVAAHNLIFVLFGPRWMAAVPLVKLICLSAAISASFSFAHNVLAATGNVAARLRISLLVSPFVVGSYLLGAQFSVEAVALFASAPLLLAAYLYGRQLKRSIGLEFLDLWRACRSSAMVTGAVMAAGWAAAQLHGEHGMLGTSLELVLQVLAGLGAWWLACHALKHPIALEVAGLVRMARDRFGRRAGTDSPGG